MLVLVVSRLALKHYTLSECRVDMCMSEIHTKIFYNVYYIKTVYTTTQK